jgi:hypothetical protein
MKTEKDYKVVNGTYYDPRTPDALIKVLEQARTNEKRILLTYGDPETGISWGETEDIRGKIGRSNGTIKVPLLIEKGQHGGGSILDHAIIQVRSEDGKTQLWTADNFKTPVVTVVPSDMPEYRHNVILNDILIARCKTTTEAAKLLIILA